MKPLEPPDSHISAAIGWLGLGNVAEAGAELEKMRRNSSPIRMRSPSSSTFTPPPGNGMRRRRLPGRSPGWNRKNRAHGFRWRMRPGGKPAAEFPGPAILIQAQRTFPKEKIIA